MAREKPARDLLAIVGVVVALSPIVPNAGAVWCLPQLGLQPVPDAGIGAGTRDLGKGCSDQSAAPPCGAIPEPGAVVGGRRIEARDAFASAHDATAQRRRQIAYRPAPVLMLTEGGFQHAALSLS